MKKIMHDRIKGIVLLRTRRTQRRTIFAVVVRKDFTEEMRYGWISKDG